MNGDNLNKVRRNLCGGLEVKLGTLLSLALHGSEWSASCSGRSNPEDVSSASHRTGRLSGPQSRPENLGLGFVNCIDVM
jgi:hypothetical protein